MKIISIETSADDPSTTNLFSIGLATEQDMVKRYLMM